MNESFVFYKSFMDAVQDLPPEVRCEAYEAIMTYSFTGEEPEMSQIAKIVFRMAKPQLDANKDRRKNAKKGGEAKRDKAKAEQKTSTADTAENDSAYGTQDVLPMAEKDSAYGTQDAVPNVNVNVNENVNDNGNVNENVKGKSKEKTKKEKDALAERSFSEPVKDALSDWLQYKREKGQSYKPTGLKQLLDGVETEVNNRGEPAVIEGIRNSMQNNWQGIFYPRPQPQRVDVFDADAYLRERMMTG